MSEPELVAVKRDWVPEWLWDMACTLIPLPPDKRLPLYQPFKWILTRTPDDH